MAIEKEPEGQYLKAKTLSFIITSLAAAIRSYVFTARVRGRRHGVTSRAISTRLQSSTGRSFSICRNSANRISR